MACRRATVRRSGEFSILRIPIWSSSTASRASDPRFAKSGLLMYLPGPSCIDQAGAWNGSGGGEETIAVGGTVGEGGASHCKAGRDWVMSSAFLQIEPYVKETGPEVFVSWIRPNVESGGKINWGLTVTSSFTSSSRRSAGLIQPMKRFKPPAS